MNQPRIKYTVSDVVITLLLVPPMLFAFALLFVVVQCFAFGAWIKKRLS